MHVEIQVAWNFLISFLYTKLPRRRVNQFGEELGKALTAKFAGHWYPDQPAKGSAYRCLKTANPLDPVFEIAARNCGLELSDVQEYLPSELTIWIEPGEVSYRMSEKDPVKLLYQENEQTSVAEKRVQSFNASSEQAFAKDNNNNDLIYNFNNPPTAISTKTNNSNTLGNLSSVNNNNEQLSNDLSNGNGSPGTSSNHSSTSSSVDSGFNDAELAQRKIRSFNPEAQCFKPIESLSLINSFNNNQTNANQYSNSMLANNYSFSIQSNAIMNSIPFSQATSNTFPANTNASSYFSNNSTSLKSPNQSTAPTTNNFALPSAGPPKQPAQMTVGQFAATKFGSIKPKTTNNSSTGAICGINGTTKRNYTNRMSPTEFSNYIKQRALLQQQQQQQQQQAGINTLSQSLNGHQLQVPINGTNNFGSFGLNNNSLFNGLSPQQSRSISPISSQDNSFLLMAAAAAVSNNSNQTTNGINSSNLMRSTLSTNNTSPISAANAGISGCLNSAGNSVCSSLSSNSGSTSLKLMLNNQTASTSVNLLSPSSNSAPSGENLLGDINYLSELFNNTSLSPIFGNSASLNSSSQNCGLMNSSINNSMNSTMNAIESNNVATINRFNTTQNSFLDLNANSFLNYSNNYNNVIGSKPAGEQFNQTQQDINNQQDRNQPNQHQHGNQPQQQQQQPQQQNQNNQNLPKSNENNEKQFNDSYSVSNGVIYPNQYQHLLVAN